MNIESSRPESMSQLQAWSGEHTNQPPGRLVASGPESSACPAEVGRS